MLIRALKPMQSLMHAIKTNSKFWAIFVKFGGRVRNDTLLFCLHIAEAAKTGTINTNKSAKTIIYTSAFRDKAQSGFALARV